MKDAAPIIQAPASPSRRSLVCALLGAWVIALAWVLGSGQEPPRDAALEIADSPAGIVSLQLAFTTDRANRIIAAWRTQTSAACGTAATGQDGSPPLTDCARDGLVYDLGRILAYTAFGWLVFRRIAQRLGVAPSRFWRLLSWLPLAAGLADLGENVGLGASLGASGTQLGWVVVTGILALVKFALLAATLVAAVFVLGFCAFHRSVARGKGATERPPYLIRLEEVVARERTYLRSRRIKAGLPASDDPPPMGLALSGGGIRSATLSLGVIQVLARCGIGPRIDYLSTVSGGGYIGATLSSLLSCKVRGETDRPGDPDQFVFGPKDRPHFDLTSAQHGPFHDVPDGPDPDPKGQWLGGRMVVAHLRAFGDYLVRRRRLIDRDVLRALGTVLVGTLTTLTLFAVLMLIPAALILAAVTLTGTSPFPAVCSVTGYLGDLVDGAGGASGLAWAAGLGGMLALIATLVGGFCADLTPPEWFDRDGDTREDARQRRTLWLLAALTIVGALAAPGALRLLIPGVLNGLLLPTAFLVGGLLVAILIYLSLGTRVFADRLPFELETRSYHGAIIALYLYLLVAALGLAAITATFGLLATRGVGLSPATLTGGGGAVLVGTLVSGLMAWLQGRKSSATGAFQQVKGWFENASDTARRMLLGLAVAVVLVVGLALSMVLVEAWVREWDWRATHGVVDYLVVAGSVTALVWIVTRVLGFNTLSLHYFYRDRLTEAYLTTVASPPEGERGGPRMRRNHGLLRLVDLHGRLEPTAAGAHPGPAQGARPGVGIPFAQYRVASSPSNPIRRRPDILREPFPGAATAAPYHLCNTCLNLATERDAGYRSRKSDIFLFSKLYCGSRATGYVDTALYRSGETKLARAVTISGAAADSAVGRDTFFAQSFAATLFNIRLGQWLENPRYRNGAEVWRRETGVFWPWYLLMETLGMSDSRHRLVHLSDGGHTGDNLGLIPLLQRRCSLILAVDGEEDADFGFGSLMHAIHYAEADLGIRVDLHLDDLRPDAAGQVARHYAVATIIYPATGSLPEARGQLVLLKSSIHSEDAEPVRKYRQAHPVFPHETTLDQFFAEEQFDIYRQLGQDMANQLLRDHPEFGEGRIDPPWVAAPPRWRPPEDRTRR